MVLSQTYEECDYNLKSIMKKSKKKGSYSMKSEVYIISGFLGSGKTTLLMHMLKLFQNKKVAILMNEMGDFNIDGQIVGDTPMNELLNGCMCCDLKSDVEVQLHTLYYEYKPDIILIEATGAAHPVEIYDACSVPSLMDKIYLKSIITVVDGLRFLARDQYSISTKRLMEEQVMYSHIVLINKTDVLNKEELNLINQEINRLAPFAKKQVTSYAQIDNLHLQLTGEAFERGKHVHHGLNSMTYHLTGPVDSRQFHNFLAKLPSNVLRAKGYVKFMENKEQTVLFQYAYGIPQYEVEIMNLPNVIVIIGENIDVADLKNKLDSLQFGGVGY